MVFFKLTKYNMECPSCELPLELVVSRNKSDVVKWIKSSGLKWPREMRVGEVLKEGCECLLCRSELTLPDFEERAVATTMEKAPPPVDNKTP